MFRAVVHIRAAYVLHKRSEQNIPDENEYTQNALEKIAAKFFMRKVGSVFYEHPAEQIGHDEKQAYRKGKP